MPKTSIFLSFGLLIAGCVGAGSFDVELTDDPSPVTDAAGDSLLRLSIVDAPEPLALTAVQIMQAFRR